MQLIIDGLAVRYEQVGNGPPLVMLHGWGSDLHAFDPLVAKLATRFTISRFDWPGFGGSELPGGDWDVPGYADFLAKVCVKQGLQSPVILAHSFGGRVAMNAVARGLLTPSKLILIGSGGVKTSSKKTAGYRAIAKVGKVATALAPGVRQKLRRRLYASAGSTDYLTAGPLRQTFRNTISHDSLPDAVQIRVPTLLVWGADDTETPVEQGRRFESTIDGSHLEIVLHAGHYVWLDQPETVDKLLADWL